MQFGEPFFETGRRAFGSVYFEVGGSLYSSSLEPGGRRDARLRTIKVMQAGARDQE